MSLRVSPHPFEYRPRGGIIGQVALFLCVFCSGGTVPRGALASLRIYDQSPSVEGTEGHDFCGKP